MNPTQFIRPTFFHALFDQSLSNNNLSVNQDILDILSKLNLLETVKEIAINLQSQDNLPAPAANQETKTQEAVIAANVMPAINYILRSLQSFIVSIKQLMNLSAEEVLRQQAYKFSFSAAEDLEILRKELTKDSITIVQVAKLFDVQSNPLQLKYRVEIPAFFKDSFETIKNLLQTELTKNEGDLQEKLQQLKAGKDRHWYDFKFLENTNYPKAVEIFKTCMSYITDLLIAATSISKDLVNYVYTFYKPDATLLEKNSAEVVSKLNRNRGEQPLEWAKLGGCIKASQQI